MGGLERVGMHEGHEGDPNKNTRLGIGVKYWARGAKDVTKLSRARFRLGVGVKNYGGQYGMQWACNGPFAWNQIYVSYTVPTFMCKLVGTDLRSNLKPICIYNSS